MLTGTSSGIGLELAKLLREQNDYRVVVTSRISSISSLKIHLKEHDHFWIRPLDITSEQSMLTLLQEVESKWGGIDILINNAGITYRSVVEEMTCVDEEIQIKTNYIGPFHLIRLCLPYMRKQKWGRIINISSVGGVMAMPTMASYSASKFALEGATEALWYEMKPWNVKTTLIQPGFVNSESFRNTYFTDNFNQNDSPYEPYYRNMSHLIERLMQKSNSDSKDVAKVILKVMKQKNPKLRVGATLDAHLFILLRRLLPRFIYHPLFYYLLPNLYQWNQPSPLLTSSPP